MSSCNSIEQTCESPALDNLVRTVLIAVALTVLLGVVFFCLPNRSEISKDFRSMWTQAEAQMGSVTTRSMTGIQGAAHSRVMRVSYNDPRVKSTLHLPWAR